MSQSLFSFGDAVRSVSSYYILPDSLNLETLLVEETPRVKPKKPTAGIVHYSTVTTIFFIRTLYVQVGCYLVISGFQSFNFISREAFGAWPRTWTWSGPWTLSCIFTNFVACGCIVGRISERFYGHQRSVIVDLVNVAISYTSSFKF